MPPCRIGLRLPLLRHLFILAIDFFRSRSELLLENLALRQQLAVLRQRRPQPRFAASDRFFRVMLRRFSEHPLPESNIPAKTASKCKNQVLVVLGLSFCEAHFQNSQIRRPKEFIRSLKSPAQRPLLPVPVALFGGAARRPSAEAGGNSLPFSKSWMTAAKRSPRCCQDSMRRS